MNVTLSLARPKDDFIDAIVAGVRDTDCRGVRSAMGCEITATLIRELCDEATTVVQGELNGEPAMLCGVQVLHSITGTGDLWFYGSKLLQEHKKTFAQMSKFVVDRILLVRHPRIRIGVDDWYKVSMSWAKWLGFKRQRTQMWPGGSVVHVLMKEAS